MTALEHVTEGLRLLRGSWAYKKTRSKYASQGLPFRDSLMGKAEAAFMSSPLTAGAIERGLELLRGAYYRNVTKLANPLRWESTLVCKAEREFEAGYRESLRVVNPFSRQNGVQANNPRGGDDVPGEVAAGFTIAAANVGDYSINEWQSSEWVKRHLSAGMTVGVWARCMTPQDCERLCRIAKGEGFKLVIHNVETELQSTCPVPAIAQVVRAFPELHHAIQPEPWVQNNVRLTELSDLNVTTLLEAYWNADPRFLPSDLAQHARDLGARDVSAAFGAGVWSDAQHVVPPSQYFQNWPTGPYFVYPIDSKNPLEWRRG